jgi:hypothetical protein
MATWSLRQAVFISRLQGRAYHKDNQKVFKILTQLLSGTGAWTWIRGSEPSKNGKGAYELLRTHYNGPGQIKKRLGYVRNILANTHNRS